MQSLFAVTLFVSATLLFLIEPLFAKMVLPMLGGTPAVWNTCMVFYQGTLLLGYAYVHISTTWLGVRRQALMHIGLLLLPLIVLPIGIPKGWEPPVQQNPIPWLLLLLIVSVGFPFFVVSASAPMLQKWFANTGHPSANDPYFLYGASNLGSMLALLGYPVLIEPNLRLSEQSFVWAGGYGFLILLILICVMILWRSPSVSAHNTPLSPLPEQKQTSSNPEAADSLTVGRRARWVVLSFVPSGLMLGVTTYFTSEISPIPLLWIIPLSIYLLTFIMVFSRRPLLSHTLMVRVLPFAVLPLAIWVPLGVTNPLWLFIPLHFVMFFIAAMVCHGELARSRPPTEHLTEFYLWISVGGVLGGLFNALLAPMVFKTVVEYPLMMVFACILRPHTYPQNHKRFDRWLDFGLPAALGALAPGIIWGAEASGVNHGLFSLGLAVCLPMVCFSFRHRPIRFGLGVGAIMLATTFSLGEGGRILHTDRSFFGVYRIKEDTDQKYRLLFSGTTIHGAQSLDPARRREPLLYFFHTGPIGQLFEAYSGRYAKPRVAIVGLGTGSMACYGEPGQQFTFYEIDPAVERIARDARYFTFLRECPPAITVVLGDARLSLRRAPDRGYGLIVIDAFSSDSIPLHLLTREAIRLYLAKLADDGILAFHISNRYLDLRPVLGDLARDAGLVNLVQVDSHMSDSDKRIGKLGSWWGVMARQRNHLGLLAEDPRWNVIDGRPRARVWTDDFSNILDLIKWK